LVTAIDTNVIVLLMDADKVWNEELPSIFRAASEQSRLVISAPVYAELTAYAGRSQSLLDDFLDEARITVEWELGEVIWRQAGSAFREYSERRTLSGSGHPRRILADFLIGAHALVNGYTLLTLDQRHYRKAFPRLKLQRI